MGFFDFLRKKEKKEETTIVNVQFSELGNWFVELKKEESEKINTQLQNVRNEIAAEKLKLEQNLEVLKQANIMNPSIHERAKHIMEGNRKMYVEKINTFQQNIELPQEIEQINLFIRTFDKNLDSLEKGVAKSHAIMVEFFHEKATNILTNIKNIDRQIKEIKKILENSSLSNITKLEEKVGEYIQKISEENKQKELFMEAEKELHNFASKIAGEEQDIQKTKESAHYKELIVDVQHKEQLAQDIEIVNGKIKRLFSEIEPALKKYENASKNVILKKYLQDPLATLVEDEHLEIVTIIEATRKAMIMNEIDLNEKKRSRVFNEISAITRETVAQFKNEKQDMEKKKIDIESHLHNSGLITQIYEREKALVMQKTEFERQKSSFTKARDKFKELNHAEIKSELEKEIKEKLGREVHFSEQI